jgi:uncharacterized protein
MKTYTLRLHPGQDLKLELIHFAENQNFQAAFLITCVGSLTRAALRLANQPQTDFFEDKFEIVSLVGTLSKDGPHLHISISDGTGKTIGGHLQEGSLIYTTAEIILGVPENVAYHRPVDPQTGWDELMVKPL